MEKTHVNVSFAYLSILLGCLCLHESIREKFVSVDSKHSLERLASSIKEFIMVQKMAAKAMEGDGQTRPESGATERLQKLVEQLGKLLTLVCLPAHHRCMPVGEEEDEEYHCGRSDMTLLKGLDENGTTCSRYTNVQYMTRYDKSNTGFCCQYSNC